MTTWKDLKDNPLWIIAIVVFGTIGATSLVYERFLMPARDPSGQREITRLQYALDESNKNNGDVAQLRRELVQVRADLMAAQSTSTFAMGSPYPVGELSRVKVGDAVEKIAEIFGEQVKKNKDMDEILHVEISTSHPHFRTVTYFFDGATRKVEAILFHARLFEGDAKGALWIRSEMSRILDVSPQQGRRATELAWFRPGKETVFISTRDESTSYSIHQKDYAAPRPLPSEQSRPKSSASKRS